MHRELYLIAHNIRSTHNVGSLLRTAEGLGVKEVIFTGYTPYPLSADDSRLPHLAEKINKQIGKTALGAEATQPWRAGSSLDEVLEEFAAKHITVAALELSPDAIALPDFRPPEKLAIILGSEVEGISQDILKRIPLHLMIPMSGQKESFNVASAAAMALYAVRFAD